MITKSVYVVEEGDWDRIERYRGPSLFFAGLAAARTRRDLRGWMMGGARNDAITVYNANGIDEDTNGLTDEEDDFFASCVEAGQKRHGSEWAARRRQAVNDRILAEKRAKRGAAA